jgi:hypothetical protein
VCGQTGKSEAKSGNLLEKKKQFRPSLGFHRPNIGILIFVDQANLTGEIVGNALQLE